MLLAHIGLDLTGRMFAPRLHVSRDLVARARPEVALVDIDLPGADGLTAAAQLREQCPECRVLILTVLGKPGNFAPGPGRARGRVPAQGHPSRRADRCGAPGSAG